MRNDDDDNNNNNNDDDDNNNNNNNNNNVRFWRDSPKWARASSFTRFLNHTQRRTTVGRTPLDER